MENNTNVSARGDYSSFFTPGAIIVAGLLIAGGMYFGLTQKSGGLAGDGTAPIAVDIEDVKTEGDPYIGRADAPVVLAAWGDYQCPFCKQFETAVLPSLVEQYVREGKLKIIFKDFAFLSEDSTTAAEYGRAVWDLYPAQYEAWRAAMYEAQDEEHGGFGNAASIDALIKKQFSQMSLTQIKTQLTAQKEAYSAAIEANRVEGQNFGINGTPGFIIGKQLINGAQPLSAFTAAIDAEL